MKIDYPFAGMGVNSDGNYTCVECRLNKLLRKSTGLQYIVYVLRPLQWALSHPSHLLNYRNSCYIIYTCTLKLFSHSNECSRKGQVQATYMGSSANSNHCTYDRSLLLFIAGITMPFLIAQIIFVAWIAISAMITYHYRSAEKAINFQKIASEEE